MIELDFTSFVQAPRWYIAYSGGLDSCVLLHLLNAYPNHPPITAIHVHHGLQADADNWLNHCKDQAEALNITFIAKKVQFNRQKNIEENARLARYQALFEVVGHGGILFTAHHQDDQIETFFYRLLRGAGLRGLKAMTAQRSAAGVELVRPLLALTKAELLHYAERHQLSFVEDPSNQDLHYQRNFLRHKILPALESLWPAYRQSIGQAINHLDQAQSLLDELAEMDLSNVLDVADGNECINLEKLFGLSHARQVNVLRYWLYQVAIYPSNKQLTTLFEQVIAADKDRNPELKINGYCVRRYRQGIYLSKDDLIEWQECVWSTDEPLSLPGIGQFVVDQPIKLKLDVRKRQSGEKFLLPSGQHKLLKQWLQEQAIAPWQRDFVPLFYYQGQLIAVADKLLTKEGQQLLQGAKICRIN